jgi:hypothetical protein
MKLDGQLTPLDATINLFEAMAAHRARQRGLANASQKSTGGWVLAPKPAQKPDGGWVLMPPKPSPIPTC